MNILRYETEVRKDADKLHQHAQQSGEYSDYIRAAELYEKVGDWDMARRCREAAGRLVNK